MCRDICTGPGNRCIEGACGCPPNGCPNQEACVDGSCTDLCDTANCQEPYYDPAGERWVCLIC